MADVEPGMSYIPYPGRVTELNGKWLNLYQYVNLELVGARKPYKLNSKIKKPTNNTKDREIALKLVKNASIPTNTPESSDSSDENDEEDDDEVDNNGNIVNLINDEDEESYSSRSESDVENNGTRNRKVISSDEDESLIDLITPPPRKARKLSSQECSPKIGYLGKNNTAYKMDGLKPMSRIAQAVGIILEKKDDEMNGGENEKHGEEKEKDDEMNGGENEKHGELVEKKDDEMNGVENEKHGELVEKKDDEMNGVENEMHGKELVDEMNGGESEKDVELVEKKDDEMNGGENEKHGEEKEKVDEMHGEEKEKEKQIVNVENETDEYVSLIDEETFGDLGEIPDDGNDEFLVEVTDMVLPPNPVVRGPLFGAYFPYNCKTFNDPEGFNGDFVSGPPKYPTRGELVSQNSNYGRASDKGILVDSLKVFGTSDTFDGLIFYESRDAQVVKVPTHNLQELVQVIINLMHQREMKDLESKFNKGLEPLLKQIKAKVMNRNLALQSLKSDSQKKHIEVRERIKLYDSELQKMLQEKTKKETVFRNSLKIIDFNSGNEQVLAFKNGQIFVRK